jgi:transcriptional regulator with XRE-family HTH domain
MNTRLKLVRESLNLTQDAFGKRIGSARNTIANYETGNRTPSNAVLTSICKEFNVNEEWLRTGEGEMFNELDMENELMAWAGRVLAEKDESFKKRFIKMLMSLDEDEWEVLAKFMSTMVDEKKD